MDSLDKINTDVKKCNLCPRLREHCQEIAREKKRAHIQETYWGKPVPGFGDKHAAVWIVGLAPAAHGANRTGRMFTGDSSGDWLYRTLHKVGWASKPSSTNISDGLILNNVYISASAHCAPPDNKPSIIELKNCRPYLLREFNVLKPKAILALGQIAFKSVLDTLGHTGYSLPTPLPKFKHDGMFHVEKLRLYTSYHPSRQNTNTGKLTRPMWEGVFERIKRDLEDHALSERHLITPDRVNGLDKPRSSRRG